MDWENPYTENDYTTQSKLQIQCNPYQATKGIFHRARTNNFTIYMEIQKTSRLLWLFEVFLYFHANCEIICSSSVKNTFGRLIGIALNLQIALGSILIFIILILPINEHDIFLHLFVSSLISFISVLQFYIYRSFVSLGKFIPKYSILFITMVNGIVSLISHCQCIEMEGISLC